jgi:predicted TIM-barrel fold metal-dependent hydrolase
MTPDIVINIHGHLKHKQDLAARISLWREWNIVRFCCGCINAPGFFGNEDFLAARERHGEILVGLAAVRMKRDATDTATDIERYREQGFEGLKCILPDYPYHHDAYFPIYARAEALGMPILFHTGYVSGGGDGNRRRGVDAEHMRPAWFDRIAREFPNLKIIGAHLGNQYAHEAIALMEFFPNIHFDITGGGGGRRHVRRVLSALLPHPGLETDMTDPEQNTALPLFHSKLLFGTDNPEPGVWIPNSERIMDRLRIPASARRNFYYRTAARLFDWREYRETDDEEEGEEDRI